MTEESEGYVLSTEDCVGLAGIRSSVAMLSAFAKQIGSEQSAQKLEGELQWLDGFMDRIGATEMLMQSSRQDSAYHIDPESVKRTE